MTDQRRPIARSGLPAADRRVRLSADTYGGIVQRGDSPEWLTVQMRDAFAAVAFLDRIVGISPDEPQPAARYGDLVPGESIPSLYSRLTIMVRLNSEYVMPEWMGHSLPT